MDDLSIIAAAQSNAATMRRNAAVIRKIAAALDGVYITRRIVPRLETLFPDAVKVYYGIHDYGKNARYAVIRFENGDVNVTLASQDAPRLSRAALEAAARYYDDKAARIMQCCATYSTDICALDAVSAYIGALQRRVDTVREAARAR